MSSPDRKIHEVLERQPLANKASLSSKQLMSQCFLGIEVELEKAHELVNKTFKYWEAKGDGSLRDEGVEIVFREPLQGKHVIAALTEMQDNIEGTRTVCTEYCSTHVHMNFLSSTQQDVMNFLALYLVLEDGLARYCGPNRENNLFCLTVSNAEEQLELYRQMYLRMQSGKSSIVHEVQRRGGQRALKYSAMNVAALGQYGTLESRLMYGIKEKKPLLDWINILLRIRSKAIELGTVHDILASVSEQGPMAFVQEVLGETIEAQEFFREEEVYEGIDRVQYMISGY